VSQNRAAVHPLESAAFPRRTPIADQRQCFGDETLLESLLWEAGFHDVRTRRISRIIRFAADTPFLQLNAIALVGMSGAGKAMDDRERKRVADAIATDSESVRNRYADGSDIAFELSTNLAKASIKGGIKIRIRRRVEIYRLRAKDGVQCREKH
jgi:hypothetical protein